MLAVDAGQELGPINPLVYGTNYGPWMPIRPETLPLAEQAGLTLLRYPGGEWGDTNNLEPYQIDSFVALARKMGAEPYIHVRLPGGTPEQAVALIRYANEEKGYTIRYWSIGNEPSIYQNRDDRKEWDTAYFNRKWREFAQAMKSADPSIVLIGPELHQWTGNPAVDPKDSMGRDWMREFLKANGDLVDIVSFHRYPFPNTADKTPASIDDLRANSAEWDSIIPALRQAIREETGRDLPVAVTEVNSHWSQSVSREATPDSFYNAIWWADVLGRLIRQKVDAVAHFDLASGGESGFGMLAKYDARPTYYVYPLYKMFGQELIYTSSGDPDVSVTGALRDDGTLTLMVVNLGPDEKSMPLQLAGFAPGGPAEIWRLDKDHKAEQIDAQILADGSELVVPGQSVTLIALPQGG